MKTNCVMLILFVAMVGTSGCFNADDPRQFSLSTAEAKKRGTFVCEVEIIPNPLWFAGKKITFGGAWLERMPGGDYALCFFIEQVPGKDVFQGSECPFFVRGDRGAGFQERHGRDWFPLFVEYLDSDDLSSVRASLIKSWKDERPKDIRFVRKDK